MAEPPSLAGEILSRVSPLQYVAASILAVYLEPRSFLLVGLTVTIVYHFVLSQIGFLEVDPRRQETKEGDGHPILRLYRRAAPVLTTAGLLLYVVDVPSLSDMVPAVLIAFGTALILGVKTISFASSVA